VKGSEAERAWEIAWKQARAKGQQRASEREWDWELSQQHSSERVEPAQAIEQHKAQAVEPSWKREPYSIASQLPLLR
jgi:hypothetical protein